MTRDEFKRILTPKFCKSVEKVTGIKLIPHIFPWRYMGCTDEEFLGTEMKFSHGPVIPEEHKVKMLKCVREQEEIVHERLNFVKKREKVMGKPPKYVQLELFS
jgi:hypothetical protein